MKDYLSKLQTIAWRTSGARYNAYRRLKRREFFSTLSLAIFSAASAAIAFVQKVYAQPNSAMDRYFTAASVCIGVVLLAISLIEWGSANGAKAENLFANAELLNEFHRKVELFLVRLNVEGSLSWAEVEGLNGEYEAIKSRCNNNHEPIDDLVFLAQKRRAPEFKYLKLEGLKIAGYYFYWYFISFSYFAVLWLVLSFSLVYPFVKWG